MSVVRNINTVHFECACHTVIGVAGTIRNSSSFKFVPFSTLQKTIIDLPFGFIQ